MESGAASLSTQFRTLAQDFRGTDPAGGYQRVIELAAYGAKLCRKAYGAGLLDLTRYKRLVALLAERASKNTCQQDDLQSLICDLLLEEYGEIPDEPDALDKLLDQRLDERKMWPSVNSAKLWAGTWETIVSHLSWDHPEELPCNLFVTTSDYEWYFRGRFRGEALRNAKREWRSLAQNYAMVADWLAEHLQAGDPGGEKNQEPRIPVCQCKKVKLFGPGEQPEVNGKRKPALTTARYDAIKALIDAGETGLTKDELDRKSKHGDTRKTLKRLADADDDWRKVISFPGTTGKGYRIR